MSPQSAIAFAIGMFFLAISPGPGLATILSRALSSGAAAGLAVTAGLVLADFVFIAIAMAGLTAIAAALGPFFQIVKYAGALYLLWLGWRAWHARGGPLAVTPRDGKGLARDVGVGFLVTIGNPKAILFYSALLPSFLDVSIVGLADAAVLCGIVSVVAYLVYGCYIGLALRGRRFLQSPRATRWLHRATGGVLIGAGIAVATR